MWTVGLVADNRQGWSLIPASDVFNRPSTLPTDDLFAGVQGVQVFTDLELRPPRFHKKPLTSSTGFVKTGCSTKPDPGYEHAPRGRALLRWEWALYTLRVQVLLADASVPLRRCVSNSLSTHPLVTWALPEETRE